MDLIKTFFLIIFLLVMSTITFADNILFINSGYPGDTTESLFIKKIIYQLDKKENNYYSYYLKNNNYDEELYSFINDITPSLIITIDDQALQSIEFDYFDKIPIIFISKLNLDYYKNFDKNFIYTKKLSGIFLNIDYIDFINIMNKCDINIKKILILINEDSYPFIFDKYKPIYDITIKQIKYIGDLYLELLNYQEYDCIYLYITQLKNRVNDNIILLPLDISNVYMKYSDKILISNDCSININSSATANSYLDYQQLLDQINTLILKSADNKYSIITFNKHITNFSFHKLYFQRLNYSKKKCLENYVK